MINENQSLLPEFDKLRWQIRGENSMTQFMIALAFGILAGGWWWIPTIGVMLFISQAALKSIGMIYKVDKDYFK